MESNVGKITWGYIWRLILWTIATSIVFLIILQLIVGSGMNNISMLDSDAISNAISSMKVYVIGYAIINILIIILSCRFATSGIRKKFNIDDTNRQPVIRNVIIVLIVCAVILLVYNISNISTITESFENIDEDISEARSVSLTDEEDELVEEIEGLVSLTKVAVAVIIISNVVVIIAMIPFVKKWLNEKTA